MSISIFRTRLTASSLFIFRKGVNSPLPHQTHWTLLLVWAWGLMASRLQGILFMHWRGFLTEKEFKFMLITMLKCFNGTCFDAQLVSVGINGRECRTFHVWFVRFNLIFYWIKREFRLCYFNVEISFYSLYLFPFSLSWILWMRSQLMFGDHTDLNLFILLLFMFINFGYTFLNLFFWILLKA